MIVRELIAALEKLNAPDKRVHVAFDSGYGTCGLHSVFTAREDNPDIAHDYPSSDVDSGPFVPIQAGEVILRTDQ